MALNLDARRGSSKPIIQTGKRVELAIQEPEFLGSFRILRSWRDSDPLTWPQVLRYFWLGVYDHESARRCARNIRKYYPEDGNLIKLADWLEKFDKVVVFELSY